MFGVLAITAALSLGASAQHSYTATNFSLELGGQDVGLVKSIDDGVLQAEVVDEASSTGPSPKKHLGPPAVDPLQLQVAMPTAALIGFVNGAWNGNVPLVNGVLRVGSSTTTIEQRQYVDLLLTGFTVPTLDASVSAPLSFELRFDADLVRSVKPGGGTPKGGKGKALLASSFRLSFPGLDTTKVSRIESFTVESNVAPRIGDQRLPDLRSGVTFPNLEITLAESSASTWFAWFDTFVVQGNNGDAHEKSGSIEFLDATAKQALLRIDLSQCGILPARARLRQAPCRRVVAQLYCEKFALAGGTTPGP